jgi:phosphoglycerate dehydrogenase-like enzyme
VRVLFCGTGWLPIVGAIRDRLPATFEVWARDPLRSIAEQVVDADVVLPSNGRIGREELDAAKKLRLIQQPAVGTDGVDLEEARRRGIPVCNAPGANGQAVAESAIFLMLALAKRLPTAERMFAKPIVGEPIGSELAGKRLGLVGRGDSATRVARIAEAFGMTVRSVDSKSTAENFRAMLEESHFVSIHCPLNPRTRGLFGVEAFAVMREGAFLVNCSRGPIVERVALEAALPRLGGVGLDVFWREPWDPADPLFADPKVVTLPHVGGSTEEAFATIAGIVVENIRRLGTGEPLAHRLI